MIEVEKILKDGDLKDFVTHKDRPESTKRKYNGRIKEYCMFHNMLPSELLEEAEVEAKNSEISFRKRKIRMRLLNYREHLKSKELADKTITDKISTVRTFYRYFQIDLPIGNNGSKRVQRLETDEDIPDREIIRESLKHANKKYRAIILLMASSGMGASEVRNLKYGDFIFAVKDYLKLKRNDQYNVDEIIEQLKDCENCIGVWKIIRVKTQNEYVTFSTPESIFYVLDYLKERVRIGDPPESIDQFLFRSAEHPQNQDRQLKERAFMKYFERLNKKMQLGKNKTQPKYAFFTSHQLRRFFATTLDGVIPHDDIDRMEGHIKGQIDRAYFKTTVKKLKKSYMNGIEVLIINKAIVIDKTSEKVQELEDALKSKDKKMEDEVGKMAHRVDLLEKLLADKEFHKDITND